MSLNNTTQPSFQLSGPKDIPQPVSGSQPDDLHIRGQATDPIASPRGATDDPGTGAEAQDGGAPQQPTFQPFFTLIEDIPTGEYYHPTIHYIFSDDDTDIVTEAALRSLEAQQDALGDSRKAPIDIGQYVEQGVQETSTLLPPSIPGVRENYVILEVEPVPASENNTPAAAAPPPAPLNFGASPPNPTNYMSTSPTTQASPGGGAATTTTTIIQPRFRVTSTKSFSPDWQVMKSELVAAPTFENNEDGDRTGHGLMLKIHGTGGLPYVAESGKERGAPRLEDMMNQFAKRMAELQTVIDAAHVEAKDPRIASEETDARAAGEQIRGMPHDNEMAIVDEERQGETDAAGAASKEANIAQKLTLYGEG
ncbi:hypothetical protein N7466_005380 [Penicillium verhagenii]|uniref:uncharacterized protein n=1 Tax=Penicillium verhagenii TaxID=1562060 RepID=UPI0025459950|nr:uncharacterized protein N7466_005380 [Penicillium verhagenii]KAJ5935833.1 hypothetical protein N7466_005380 [Penicillium verhagenii]